MIKQPALFVSGSGSGTGKTTIAEALHQNFEQRSLPVHCWYEIEVRQRKEFRPFLDLFMKGDDRMVDALQHALTVYLDEKVPSGAPLITESLVPFLRWLLLGNTTNAAINEYCDWVNKRFEDRSVTLITLFCDRNAAVDRAKKDRGEQWYDQWVFKDRNFPLYKQHPELDHWSVFELEKEYYSKLGWRILEFDTAEVSETEIVQQTLSHLDLPVAGTPMVLVLNDGTYWTSQSNDIEIVEISDSKIRMLGLWLDLIPLDPRTARIANSNSTIYQTSTGFILRSFRFGNVEYTLRD
jgi:adenylate kinase family enzyme